MEPEKIETRIAILIFLPKEISSVIQNAKEKLGISYPNHETSIPHVTLYSCKFDESKFTELVKQLRKLKSEPFSIRLTDLSVVGNAKSQNLFVSIGFQDTESLQILHEEVLRVGNALRGNLVREKDVERFNKGICSQEQFSLIQKYGYEYVKDNFHPHITIGEVAENEVQKIKELKETIKDIEGASIEINKMYVLLSQRAIPSERKIKESERVEIDLVA